MKAKGVTPILNVSDMAASFAWFAKWGWRKMWDWGTPPTFGAVGSGEVEIFLCQGAQGGHGKGTNTTTFQKDGDEAGDKGAWMSVWVDDVDEAHRQCVGAGLDVTFPPTDMPWNTREMHVRHPDGHVFASAKGLRRRNSGRSMRACRRQAAQLQKRAADRRSEKQIPRTARKMRERVRDDKFSSRCLWCSLGHLI